MYRCLKSCHNSKVPEIVCLTIEFYTKFWLILGKFCVDSLNESFILCKLSTSKQKMLLIANLCTLLKLLEKHVHKHLYDYLMCEQLLHPCQSGFRSKDSCATVHTHDRCMDKQCRQWTQAGVLLIDLQNVFDTVDHLILLRSLCVWIL